MEVDSLNIKISADVDSAAQSLGSVEKELNKLGDSADTAGSDVSRLVEEMSAAAANMSNVSANIEASSSGLGGFQSNVDAVSNTLTGLNFKFDYLRDSVQNSYGAFDSAAASVENLSTASAASADALNSITTATDNFGSRMGELQASTSSTADNMAKLRNELTDALSQLRSFSTSMGNAGNDAEEASKKIAELSKQVKSIPNKQVTDLASGFKTLKGVVATLGIGKFIKDSNDAYVVQMQNELKLTAHMKQRMNATNDEIKAIKDLAAAQQKIGVIGDEIQLAGAQQLTTYARQASTLQTLIPAMNNLIAQNAGYEASVGDATSAADMLGRALNGQYTSLKRMGVVFTAAQENVLKYGTESQKAAVLADAINSKVGNMNELLANTPTGQLKQLQNEFGDLQEQIGATFQPLISSVAPILSQTLTDLKEPILTVSSGISTIGAALTRLDSPFLKFIVYGSAAATIINKLKFAMGGTAAGLLLLGTMLSFIVGKTQEEQETVGDIVTNAFNAVSTATDNATDSAKEYEDEIGAVQKAVSRLAGFDTITKLSGGAQGLLAASLYNENDVEVGTEIAEGLKSAQDEVGDLQAALNDLKAPTFDLGSMMQSAGGAIGDFFTAIFGNEDEQYDALKRLTGGIEQIFGTEWTTFWEGVGGNIYDIISGDDSKAYKGWYDLNLKVKNLFGEDFNSYWRSVGSNIADIVSGDDSRIYNGWKELRDKIKDLFGQDFTDHYQGLGADIYNTLHPQEVQSSREYTESVIGAYDWLGTITGIFNPNTGNLLKGYSGVLREGVKLGDALTNAFLSESSSRYDVPVTPSGMPSNVPKDNITVNFNVDGEQIASATFNMQDAQNETNNFRNR